MTERNENIEHRMNPDGSENPKYIDLLDEDKSISGQKFVCISFLSPEKIIKSKNLYDFNEFVKQWEMSKAFEKYTQFLNFISFKHDVDFDKLTEDLDEFIKDQKDNLLNTNIADDYKNFIDKNDEKLENNFNKMNNFQTSVRGIKIRGAFPSQQEAELRCKMLREIDPNHDVFVGPVGMWMPFHPEAYKTGRVEYLEDELNELMSEKNKNEEYAKQEFDKRIKESKQKAVEDNISKAEESGNLLSQTLDADGNLVSVKTINTFDNNLDENASVSDIHNELFNDENIITDKKNGNGLGRVTKDSDKDKTLINIAEEDPEPTVAEPTVAEPTVAEPTVAEPTVAEPTVAEPTVTEPTVTEPTVAEPTPEGDGVDKNPSV